MVLRGAIAKVRKLEPTLEGANHLIFVLVQSITAQIISKDMGIKLQRAHRVLEKSCEVGEVLYPDDGEE